MPQTSTVHRTAPDRVPPGDMLGVVPEHVTINVGFIIRGPVWVYTYRKVVVTLTVSDKGSAPLHSDSKYLPSVACTLNSPRS